MQVCVDFERELGHPDAEKDAARVEAIRARLADSSQAVGLGSGDATLRAAKRDPA